MKGQETEAKFFVRDLKRVEARLYELKANLSQARVHEVNFRFDTPNHDLQNNSKVLRLRQDHEARLTFKGPSMLVEGGVMTRKEIEFVVGDFDSAREFLESLGYQPAIFYEKFRTVFEFNQTHIMLDELPYGEFVEVEGEDGGAIRSASNMLGLKWDAIIRAGYHALFERVANNYGLDAAQLSFDALKNIKISADDLKIRPAD